MIKDVPESIVEWRHFKVKERKFLKLKRQHFANQIGEVWANERGEIWQLNVQNYYNLIELSTDRSLGGARIAPQLHNCACLRHRFTENNLFVTTLTYK